MAADNEKGCLPASHSSHKNWCSQHSVSHSLACHALCLSPAVAVALNRIPPADTPALGHHLNEAIVQQDQSHEHTTPPSLPLPVQFAQVAVTPPNVQSSSIPRPYPRPPPQPTHTTRCIRWLDASSWQSRLQILPRAHQDYRIETSPRHIRAVRVQYPAAELLSP